jgi:acetate kinase
MNEKPSILTINGGSSSIKFALYEAVKLLKRGLCGTVDCALGLAFLFGNRSREKETKLALVLSAIAIWNINRTL